METAQAFNPYSALLFVIIIALFLSVIICAAFVLAVMKLWKNEVYQDALTGLPSRRYGLRRLNQMVRRGKRQGAKPFCVCLIDLDGLKAVNDSLGHQMGDQYLVGVARVMTDVFGASKVCRLGGDEFLAIMPGSPKAEADRQMKVAERRIEEAFLAQNQMPRIPASVSYGVAEVAQGSLLTVPEILELADRRMYEMKKEKHKERR